MASVNGKPIRYLGECIQMHVEVGCSYSGRHNSAGRHRTSIVVHGIYWELCHYNYDHICNVYYGERLNILINMFIM